MMSPCDSKARASAARSASPSIGHALPVPILLLLICRKCSGAVTCNIMGRRATLKLRGERHSSATTRACTPKNGKTSLAKGWRAFCGACGTHLWLEDKRWPEGIWPNAAAIDTELPVRRRTSF